MNDPIRPAARRKGPALNERDFNREVGAENRREELLVGARQQRKVRQKRTRPRNLRTCPHELLRQPIDRPAHRLGGREQGVRVEHDEQ